MYKEYENVEEQWQQLKWSFYWVITRKLLFSGGIPLWWVKIKIWWGVGEGGVLANFQLVRWTTPHHITSSRENLVSCIIIGIGRDHISMAAYFHTKWGLHQISPVSYSKCLWRKISNTCKKVNVFCKEKLIFENIFQKYLNEGVNKLTKRINIFVARSSFVGCLH